MADCQKCKSVVDMDVPNSGYRCHACNSVFCQEHAGEHFGQNQQRAEEAEKKLKAILATR